ncbi:MAG: hypothetical protein M3Z24_15675 [Chloroflexota bacterium]|nr:hypothetical protein [Chloroflexota bacterium]
MSYTDGQPPQKRPTTPKQNQQREQREQRAIEYTGSDRDFQMERYDSDPETETDYEDPPLRPGSSTIRRGIIPPTPRITSGQGSPVPPRRTGGQPAQKTSGRLPAAPLTAAPIPSKLAPRNTTKPYYTQPQSQSKPHRNIHWLLPLGVGMIAMLVLWVLGSALLAWGTVQYDNIHYGYPRTSQKDAVVGHGGDSKAHPSHFIAVNLNRQAIIIEFMAGSPAKSISYVVPNYITGSGADLAPIELEFRDVTGDGKPDMIIHMLLHPQEQTFVFVNDGAKFRPPTSSDNIHL